MKYIGTMILPFNIVPEFISIECIVNDRTNTFDISESAIESNARYSLILGATNVLWTRE
jgi:hypothetical protein